jgi:ABC-2 type transport system ATP-binding protein
MITISNLNFAFRKGKPLFRGLNMDLHPGRTYGLFGLNGAGKTTLLNQMSGMLFPESGECLLNGKLARDRLPSGLSQLFIVPEQFDLPIVKPDLYIELHAPFYPNFNLTQAGELMNMFGIDREKLLNKHSYGQRKKFLISFALAANTPVLLMDEPTNGLDIPSKSQFRKVMATTENSDRCTVISTHQVRDLDTLIDRFTVLHNGVIIFDQTVEDISERLVFKKTTDTSQAESIYSEEILGGKRVIAQRKPGDNDTLIDLEFLFSAVVDSPDSINRAFQMEVTS